MLYSGSTLAMKFCACRIISTDDLGDCTRTLASLTAFDSLSTLFVNSVISGCVTATTALWMTWPAVTPINLSLVSVGNGSRRSSPRVPWFVPDPIPIPNLRCWTNLFSGGVSQNIVIYEGLFEFAKYGAESKVSRVSEEESISSRGRPRYT